MRLFLVCGVSGSGKSFLLRNPHAVQDYLPSDWSATLAGLPEHSFDGTDYPVEGVAPLRKIISEESPKLPPFLPGGKLIVHVDLVALYRCRENFFYSLKVSKESAKRSERLKRLMAEFDEVQVLMFLNRAGVTTRSYIARSLASHRLPPRSKLHLYSSTFGLNWAKELAIYLIDLRFIVWTNRVMKGRRLIWATISRDDEGNFGKFSFVRESAIKYFGLT